MGDPSTGMGVSAGWRAAPIFLELTPHGKTVEGGNNRNGRREGFWRWESRGLKSA